METQTKPRNGAATVIDASQEHPIAMRPERQAELLPADDHPSIGRSKTLVEIALARGMGLEVIERLIEVDRDRERYEAEKAFNAAFADFKSEVAVILKTTHVSYMGSKGPVDYDHAELADVLEVVGPLLSKHGFSWNWVPHQERGWLSITCKLRHRLGHMETATLTGPDDSSGGKNQIQAIGSTATYLERYTFKAITGTAEKGQDTDSLVRDSSGQNQNQGRGDQQSRQPSGQQRPPATQAQATGHNPDDFYSESMFKANLATWRQNIKSGRKTAAQLIAHIEERGGKPLTQAQKDALSAD